MGVRGERAMAAAALTSIRTAMDPVAARHLIAEHIPAAIAQAMTEDELERVRLRLQALPSGSIPRRIRREDGVAALAVFLLVFLCVIPVVLPFVVVDDVRLALRLSNLVAVMLLFFACFILGSRMGRPWRTGCFAVTVGAVLVAVAIALGG